MMKTTDKKKDESNQLQNIDAFEEALSKIEAATGITDIKQLVTKFV